MRIVTWNMSHWGHRPLAQTAWERLRSLDADVALLQEAAPDVEADAWRLCPDAPWRIDEKRAWGSGIASPSLTLEPLSSVTTRYSSKDPFDVVPDGNYRGALAAAAVDVPDFGRLALVSLYGLMKPVYAQTTVLRMVADVIPLFDTIGFDGYLLGGDLNVHTQSRDRTERRRAAGILHAIESLGLVNCFKQIAPDRAALVGCGCDEDTCYHARTHLHPQQVGTSREAVGGHNDYLFASPSLAERLQSLHVIGDDDPEIWTLSDHSPVVADFA